MSTDRPQQTGAPLAIAIDGPVASGKSAAGRLLARRLGYRFLDTGLMYRAMTWLALQRGVDLEDGAALSHLAGEARIGIEPGPPDAPEAARVVVDGTDVSDKLRLAEIGRAVSLVSKVAAVREAMVRQQRAIARDGRIVMAGRDIGTVVLPDAPLKVFLDASPEERVRRRYAELRAEGRDVTEADVRDELARRDAIDSSREVSPLRPADDAVVIETDGLSLEEVVERILELVRCS